jgi:cation diffusion facilitator family transporter
MMIGGRLGPDERSTRMSDQAQAHDHDDLDHHHDHDHHHDPGQGHDHGHGHGHADGPLGWLRQVLGIGHTHDGAARVDSALAGSERGIWALKVSLLALGATALFQLFIVALSGSTALLADTIHNFGDAATSIPLWIAFALVRRGRSRGFTYGLGRAEDLAGVVIVLLIFFSACVAAYESIRKLLDPEPVTHLWWVVAAALIGFAGNEAVAIFRIRVGTEIGSAALIADGQHSRVDGFTSLAVLIGAIGVAAGLPILDPLVGLAITAAILVIVKDAATAVFRRMLDGIEPEILAQIEHAPFHVPGVEEVHAVRARWVGHRVHTDLHISVDPHLTVAESHEIAHRVERSLVAHVPTLDDATVHVCPVEAPRGPVSAAPARTTATA